MTTLPSQPTLPTVRVHNPVLRGFHPDPSILRVGDDYYLATSTFDWWPGVAIYHSRDLRHWRLAARPLAEKRFLDMTGNPNSGGIWAPGLSHDGERFYLVYTDVKTWNVGPFKDTHNYVTTATSVDGPWSDPVYLNSSGFDPSFYHEGGRSWLLNMKWDHRKGRNHFSGIVLQEYDRQTRKLIGERVNIFEGTGLGLTEGPHLYRKDGYYYLLVAEGGTVYEHAATIARSRDMLGPYEVQPGGPLLTAADDPTLPLQKAGHASLVQTQDGRWVMAHLTGRPLTPRGLCPLGRETALQAVDWPEGDWPRLAQGGHHPAELAELPALPEHPWPTPPARDDFDHGTLRGEWMTLREEAGDWLSLAERPGWLRLRGRESLVSNHHQSLLGRRLQSLHATATTSVEFEPRHHQQMAGLCCFYDSRHWVYLRVGHDEQLGKTLAILSMDGGAYDEPLAQEVSVEGQAAVQLRVTYAGDTFRFSYSLDGESWQDIGPEYDAGRLSDEHGGLGFTGTFLALCCQDLSGSALHADFDFFSYEEREQ